MGVRQNIKTTGKHHGVHDCTRSLGLLPNRCKRLRNVRLPTFQQTTMAVLLTGANDVQTLSSGSVHHVESFIHFLLDIQLLLKTRIRRSFFPDISKEQVTGWRGTSFLNSVFIEQNLWDSLAITTQTHLNNGKYSESIHTKQLEPDHMD